MLQLFSKKTVLLSLTVCFLATSHITTSKPTEEQNEFARKIAKKYAKQLPEETDEQYAQRIEYIIHKPYQPENHVTVSEQPSNIIAILKDIGRRVAPLAGVFAYIAMTAYLEMKMLEGPGFKVYQPGTIKDNFSSVAGNHEAKESFSDIVEYLKNPERYNTIGARPSKGILLTGAPGTGKTLLARALAGEANCAFIYASGSDFNGMYVGSGTIKVKKLFYQARSQYNWFFERQPCIIFIDEIEVLARHRGSSDNYGDQSVNALLTELDGFIQSLDVPVIVIAATNFPEKIDPAVLRPGRIDRVIHIQNPGIQDRENILKLHLSKVKHHPAINLKGFAQRTIGFTGAELENIIHAAARIAANKNKPMVTQKDIEEALETQVLGVISKHALTTYERNIVAYHEAGHALISMLIQPSKKVDKVTITPRGPSLGVTYIIEKEEPERIYTKDFYLNDIAMLMGGRAAEEIIFKIISTSPSDDLKQATNIANFMVEKLGMGDTLSVSTNYHDLPFNAMHENIAEILDTQYKRTKQLLLDHIDALHTLAKALLAKEILYEQDICDLNLKLQTI